jgi:hypothetical protein
VVFRFVFPVKIQSYGNGRVVFRLHVFAIDQFAICYGNWNSILIHSKNDMAIHRYYSAISVIQYIIISGDGSVGRKWPSVDRFACCLWMLTLIILPLVISCRRLYTEAINIIRRVGRSAGANTKT